MLNLIIDQYHNLNMDGGFPIQTYSEQDFLFLYLAIR